MPKPQKRFKPGLGTLCFAAIIVISIIAAYFLAEINTVAVLILGIFGALVAITNIQIKESGSFLVAISALLIIIISWFVIIPTITTEIPKQLIKFLTGIAIGFGIAGFIVALGVIARIGLEK